MSADVRAYLQYTVFAQLDAFDGEAVTRLMAGFVNIDGEADAYAQRMFESYGPGITDDDPGSWAEETHEQGIDYWTMLSEPRQATLNLLAVFLYHLFEQHRNKVEALCKSGGLQLPAFKRLMGETGVGELELFANAAKHADGPSAQHLHAVRPDLFMIPGLPAMSSRPLKATRFTSWWMIPLSAGCRIECIGTGAMKPVRPWKRLWVPPSGTMDTATL